MKKLSKIIVDALCANPRDAYANGFPLEKYTAPKYLKKIDKNEITKAVEDKEFFVLKKLVNYELCSDQALIDFVGLYESYLRDNEKGFACELKAGANPNMNLKKVAPILYRVIADQRENCVEYAKLLLKYGVDVNCVWKENGQNKTALSFATEKKNATLVGLFLDAGANQSYLVPSGGSSQLQYAYASALRDGDVEILFEYMKKGKILLSDVPFSVPEHTQKILNVYNCPELFLELEEVSSAQLEQFKTAAYYGLLKRFDRVDAKHNTVQFEQESLNLIEQIKAQSSKLEQEAKNRKQRLLEAAQALAAEPVEETVNAEQTAEKTIVAEQTAEKTIVAEQTAEKTIVAETIDDKTV